MTTRSTLTARVAVLEAELERLKADLERWRAKLERLTAKAADASMTVGTVIRWNKQFATGSRVYTYAAIRTSAGWYLTGSGYVTPRSWEELVEFMVAKGTLLSLDIATSWDPII